MKKEVTFDEAIKNLNKMKHNGAKLFPNLTDEEKRKVQFIHNEPALSAEKKMQTRK